MMPRTDPQKGSNAPFHAVSVEAIAKRSLADLILGHSFSGACSMGDRGLPMHSPLEMRIWED